MMIKTSSNLYLYWNFGSILGMIMSIQVMVGLILSTSYIYSSSDFFFNSCFIFLNINYGWMMRLMHSNLTSAIFIIIMIHINRSITYKNFMNKKMWFSGIVMLLVLMMISFLGYSLVWSQMSYWASMVITNFIMVIPIIGKKMMFLIWGNRFINNILINRFLTIHFFMALMILLMSIMHIILLHINKSTNPMMINNSIDQINLNPLFIFKDMNLMLLSMMMILIINLNFPLYMNNPDNFNQMMMFKTPNHIEPEWYFLFFYSILRSIDNKMSGLLLTMASIAVWFMVPYFSSSKFISNKYIKIFKNNNFALMMSIFVISFVGSKTAKEPYISIMKSLTILYFSSFMKMMISTKLINKL